MQTSDTIKWYEDNVGIKLTSSFFSKLGEIGVIDGNTSLDDFNRLMLEYVNGEPVKRDGKYKIKPNRIPLINAYSNQLSEEKPKQKKQPMFRIERMPNGVMKLVKK